MCKRKQINKLLCGCLMAATICFIWGNSLLNGETSGDISGGFSQWLGQFIPFLSPDSPNGHYIIRKCAHFSIFFLLGAESCCFFLMGGKGKPLLRSIALAAAVASIDESIQRFIPDRYGCLSDVLLDSCGAACGIGLLFWGYTLLKRKKQRQERTL